MSEPAAIYNTAVMEARMPEQDTAVLLRRYLLQRRRALVTELHEVEELLGLVQTVPKRERPR